MNIIVVLIAGIGLFILGVCVGTLLVLGKVASIADTRRKMHWKGKFYSVTKTNLFD